MTEPEPRFRPGAFGFLNELADNNERPWFHDNKHRYDELIKEPALEFIEAFRPRLHAISPHFEANARAVGGSLFRIQRDTRFAKDKTPYKTNTGLHFRHEQARDAHAPGFYLHIEPRNSFMGVGLWRPESKVAYAIRNHIGENRDKWIEASRAGAFGDTFELSGDSLVRPPKGFDADDPLLDDLKRKDFIGVTSVAQRRITAPDFIDDFAEMCGRAAPFMRFLCDALSMPF